MMHQKLRIVLAATGILAVLGGGISMAAVPDSDDHEYHACVKDATDQGDMHMVRVIDKESGGSCSANWTEKVWNQVGQEGPQGESGPQGPPGEVSGLERKSHDNNVNSSMYPYEVQLSCPSGKSIISAVGSVHDASVGGSTDADVPAAVVSGNNVFGDQSVSFVVYQDPFPGNLVDQVHFRILCVDGTF